MGAKHYYSSEFKQRVVEEAIRAATFSEVARKYHVNTMLISKWIRETKKNNLHSTNLLRNY